LAPYLRLAWRGLRVVDICYGGKCASLTGRGRGTASRHEWLGGRNWSVRLDCGRSSVYWKSRSGSRLGSWDPDPQRPPVARVV